MPVIYEKLYFKWSSFNVTTEVKHVNWKKKIFLEKGFCPYSFLFVLWLPTELLMLSVCRKCQRFPICSFVGYTCIRMLSQKECLADACIQFMCAFCSQFTIVLFSWSNSSNLNAIRRKMFVDGLTHKSLFVCVCDILLIQLFEVVC